MTIKELLGLRIKEIRNKLNMTQAQLAEKVGIDPKHQSCIENGKNFPSADLLNKYSIVFDIDVCELLNIEHNKDREFLQKFLINKIKTSNDEDLKIIFKIVKSVLN